MKKTFDCTLVALGFGLISYSAQADVILLGLPQGLPGHEIELSIAVTQGTVFSSIEIDPWYEDFAQVLTRVDLRITPALDNENAFGFCLDDGGCSYFFLEPTSFAADIVLATLRFRVTDDAATYTDGNRGYPFDLGVLVDGTAHPLPENQMFTVLAVPEPSTWSVTVVGIVLLIASWYGRSLRAPRATIPSADRFPG